MSVVGTGFAHGSDCCKCFCGCTKYVWYLLYVRVTIFLLLFRWFDSIHSSINCRTFDEVGQTRDRRGADVLTCSNLRFVESVSLSSQLSALCVWSRVCCAGLWTAWPWAPALSQQDLILAIPLTPFSSMPPFLLPWGHGGTSVLSRNFFFSCHTTHSTTIQQTCL